MTLPDTTLTFHDMFCGAGGSTLGAIMVPGTEPVLALNHWSRAIETHNTNFPDMRHACENVSLADPRRFPRARILLASPECTNHSLAKGARRRKPKAASLWEDGPAGDDEQDRSRATMWDVPRFAEVHRYDAIIVENVVDAFKWGPNDDGSLFHAWVNVMRALGYEHEVVYLNSMFTGEVPQSRDRMYVVYWRRGIRRPNLRFDAPAWCPACERVVDGRQHFKGTGRIKAPWGRYGQQYLYRCPDCLGVAIPGALPASTAIDWSLPAQRIGDRARPLAKNTRERIRRGLERLSSEPFAIRLLQGGSPRPTTLPLVTLTARHDVGVVMPIAGSTYETTPGNRARRTDRQPMWTVNATAEQALAVPPMGAVDARDVATLPGPTQTTTTRAALVVANRANNVPRVAVDEPVATVLTGGTLGLVYADRANTIPRDAETEPTHGVCAGANHLGVVVANYGSSKRRGVPEGWARDAALEPIGSVTTRDGHALLVPYYSQSEASVAGRTPAPTLTTRDRVGLAWGDEDIDACRFRMFDLGEIARTMAMHAHRDGREYVVTGNKRERMAQYGNAVTPPAMRLLVSRLQEVLAS